MKTLLATAAIALVAATGAASATTATSQLEAAAERVLIQNGFADVDASTLTLEQLAGVVGAESADDSYSDTRARITSAIAG